MANSPRRPSTPPHKGEAPKPEREPVIMEGLVVVKMERGYVLLEVTIEDDKVIDKFPISKSPEPLAATYDRMITQAFIRRARPRKDVSA